MLSVINIEVYLFQLRIRQLQVGASPNLRKPKYVKVDRLIFRARNLFVHQQPQPLSLNGQVNPTVVAYLRHSGFLLGGVKRMPSSKQPPILDV